jgi:hypothetical protein
MNPTGRKQAFGRYSKEQFVADTFVIVSFLIPQGHPEVFE